MAEINDPEPSTYVPPAHRIALVGNAWNTVDERITTAADGPDTVNERLSDGGPGPDGQEETVRERLSGQDPESDDEVGSPAKSALKGDWVEFAVSQGADRDEAEASTKDELIERYGD